MFRSRESENNPNPSLHIIPDEILCIILNFSLCNDFSSILILRLINIHLLELVNKVSQSLLEDYCPPLAKKFYRHDCTLFRLARSESKRLELTTRFLNNTGFSQIVGLFEFREQPIKQLNYSAMVDSKKAILSSIGDLTTKFKLTNRVIGRNDFDLPIKIDLYLKSAVNARSYEVLNEFFQTICSHKNINSDRIIDAIYLQAAESYREIEIIQLIKLIPIDINRQIQDSVCGIAANSYVYYQPLLHHAASHGNLSLVTYLVESGANLQQLSSENKSVMDILADRKDINCQLVEKYLASCITNQNNRKIKM